MAGESTAYPTLFSPLSLNQVTVKNRIVSTAHATAYAVGGYPKERYRRYYERKARGGVGLIVTFGSCSVHPSSPVAAWNGVANWDDSIIPDLAAMAAVVQRHGAKIFCQLTHMGRRGTSAESARPLYAPSPIPEPAHREMPKALDRDEIAMLVDAFAAAAGRVRQAGYDGVELTSYGGHLIEQFWDPRVNRRTDDYGGSLDNRLRFGLEVVDAVRQRVGPDFCVGLRLTGDQLVTGGLGVPAMTEIAVRMVAGGKLDYLSVSGSTAETALLQAGTVPSLDYPHALYNKLAHAIRDRVNVPVMLAGRITEPTVAEAALQRGDADLIGMTRALIADPDLPRKALAGEPQEIRRCTGANEGCIGRLYQGLPIRCVQNPLIGHEEELDTLPPAPAPRRIVVAGGGPAGMEAARVAAERGHQVILFEREGALGGQVRTASLAPGRSEYGRAIAWLARQVNKLGVEVRLRTEATPELVLAERPEAVIIATGATPRLPDFPIASDGRVQVITCDDVIRGTAEVEPLDRCLVIDEDAHMRGPSAAEALLECGARVEIISPETMVGLDIDPTLQPVLYHRLYQRGATLTPLTGVVAIEDGRALVEHVYSRQRRHIPVDVVVLALGGQARGELYDALRAAAPELELHRAGDCLAPRFLYDAMLEGTRAGRAV